MSEILNLDPSEIRQVGNSRYGLKKLRIESMGNSIVAAGGIQTPVEVIALDPPIDGFSWDLNAGFYRVAGADYANKNLGGNFLVPAIPVNVSSTTERLKRQLRENMDRENQSPMDKAVAIKRLLDEGVPKMEIRKIFSAPGGRKGLSMQPASNATINMMLSFLDFPKPIQAKIHDGTLPVGAAYELTKVHKDKWQEVLDKAEAARQKEIDIAEKEEEKFLSSTKKAAEAEQKAEKAAEELKAAEALAAETDKALQAAIDAAAEAHKAKMQKGLDADAKKKAEADFKSAEAAARTAEKMAKDAEKALAKISGKASTAAEDAKAKLAKARQEAEDKKKGKAEPAASATQRNMRKAVAETPGAAKGTPKATAMNATEMRQAIDTLSKPGGRAKVQKIGEILKACFGGEFPAAQLGKKLGEVTGEK